MKIRGIFTLLLVGGTVALMSVKAPAQILQPFGPAEHDHDLQPFAPVELNFDNQPDASRVGYFFSYEKLWWSLSGERTTVGNPDVNAFAEIIYYDNPQDINTGASTNRLHPPDPFQITNSLQDVPPNAGFAFGDRYEFGFRNSRSGWKVSILDGPTQRQSELYGFVPRGDGGVPPFIDPDYTTNSDEGPGPNGAPQADFDLRAFGFGSVSVLFNAPDGYFLGFRDYLNFVAEAIVGTQTGPYLYVGNYGVIDEQENFDDDIPVFRITDDLDGDTINGSTILFVEDEEGELIPVAIVHDWDDLHQFNVYFDNVLVRNTTKVDGVDLMYTHQISNRHFQAKNQNNYLEMYFGARYLRLDDNFRVDAQGSILGNSFWDTSFDNQIVGPQVGLRWENRHGRWTTGVDGRFMFGYNTQDWSQNGRIGDSLIPGAQNRLLYARTTQFNHGLQQQEFSPVAELRVETSYKVSKSVALKAGYTGAFVGNIRRAATSVHYNLPDMGYLEAGTQDFLINGVNFGIEFAQ
jgi:hypothetical protein